MGYSVFALATAVGIEFFAGLFQPMVIAFQRCFYAFCFAGIEGRHHQVVGADKCAADGVLDEFAKIRVECCRCGEVEARYALTHC